MSRPLEHTCKHGGTSDLVRDAESFGIPVWRCLGMCGTFFAVVDGELDQVANADTARSSELAGTTETS